MTGLGKQHTYTANNLVIGKPPQPPTHAHPCPAHTGRFLCLIFGISTKRCLSKRQPSSDISFANGTGVQTFNLLLNDLVKVTERRMRKHAIDI